MTRFSIATAASLLALSFSVTVANAGETEAFFGGLVGGLAVGAAIGDGYPGGYYRAPYNNYGNLNQIPYYGSGYAYGYDDPTVYRPVCQTRGVQVYDPYRQVYVMRSVTNCATVPVLP